MSLIDEISARKSSSLRGPNSSSPIPVTIIRPSHGWVALRLGELWEYRELLYFLTWREVKVRYKQTVLGVAWAVLQPLLTMLVFSLFFGKLAKVPSDRIPYPLFCLAGLVPWNFFANALAQSSNSLVTNSNLISKVYFPRPTIPVSAVLSGAVDFTISFALLILMMAFYHTVPTLRCVYLPLFFLLAFVTALGIGLWLSALNVEYRDVRYTVPFLTQFWMFATPIAYPSTLLSEPWRTIYGLNPMTGVVEGFRWALLGANTTPGPLLTASSFAAVSMLVGGAYYFRRLEKTFADVV
jgi:lipopolysaccharide transport system permease protein